MASAHAQQSSQTAQTAQTQQSDAGTGLSALGMGGSQWQKLLEAAYATGELQVTGELAGGQLLSYVDVSGATLTIMAAPPYSAFAGFSAVSKTEAEISMLSDVLALLEVHDDDGQPICDIAANLAQGPLLVDEEAHINDVCISALGLDTTIYPTEDDFHAAGGALVGLVVSHGAAQVQSGSGSAKPTASGELALEVLVAEKLKNSLTGEKFWHLAVASPFPMDVCLPESVAEEIPAGSVVAGRVLFSATIATPPSCGGCGGGSCGSGGCGCGGSH